MVHLLSISLVPTTNAVINEFVWEMDEEEKIGGKKDDTDKVGAVFLYREV
jgi:hypothetical protein